MPANVPLAVSPTPGPVFQRGKKPRDLTSALAMAGLFVGSQLLALIISIPSAEAGLQAFEDPENPSNALFYIFFLMFFTAIILLIIHFKKEKAIKYLFLGVFGLVLFVFFNLAGYQLSWLAYYAGFGSESVYFFLQLVMPIVFAIALMWVLVKWPEWYVVDTVGIFVAAGSTAIFGISLAILPIFVLLIGLAVYDAISVYKTKHMITLADSVIEHRLPVLLVVPKKMGYSFRKQARLKTQLKKGEERDAMFMGLGDLVIPGSLIISAYHFLPRMMIGGWLAANFVVSMGTLAGAVFGYSMLMRFVLKGKPQAGLPLLNSGAIGGYAISYLLVYQSLSLGMVFPGW